MKRSLIFFAILFSFLYLMAQSKKEIRKNKVRLTAETETSGGKTVNDTKTIFNRNGEVVEEINYDKDGSLKSIHKFKRNKEGDVTEETEYDGGSVLKSKREVKFNGMGEKSEELIYGADSKLVKKYLYTYNKQGLKTERKCLDASGKVTSVKNYSYEYF